MAFSKENMRRSMAQGDLAKCMLSQSSKHDFAWALVKKMPFPLHNREFVARQICFTDDHGRFVSVFEPPREEIVVDYGRKMNAVRGRATGFLRLTPIAGGAQCKLELYQQVAAGGRVPVFVVNSKAGKVLSFVAEMREQFQRDDEVDELERGRLAETIRDEPQVYEAAEEQFISRAQDKLGGLKEEDLKELTSPDHLVKMSMGVKEGSSTGIGRATTVRLHALRSVSIPANHTTP
jgi:hypothetical protein